MLPLTGAAAPSGGAEGSEEAKAAEWAPFTPSKVDVRLCYARTWNGGRGGQCQQFPAPGADLCHRHQKQATESFLAYGRVDGHIPMAKLREFKRAARMQSWGGAKASGDLSAGDSRSDISALKRRKSSGSMKSDGETTAKRKLGPRASQAQGSAEGAGGAGAPEASQRGGLPRSSPSSGRVARAPLSGGWLSSEGFLLEKAPGARSRAWSCEEVWAAALRQGQGANVQVSIQNTGRSDEPWASLTAAACKRAAESLRRAIPGVGGGADGLPEAGDWQVSTEAFWLLRWGVEQWVSWLLRELHTLSEHRASLDVVPRTCRREYNFDFQAALLEEEVEQEPSAGAEGDAAADVAAMFGETEEAGAAKRRKLGGDAREIVAENWQRTLGMRQRFFRVGAADLRAWLQCQSPRPGAGSPAGPRLPEASRQRFLRLAEAELAVP